MNCVVIRERFSRREEDDSRETRQKEYLGGEGRQEQSADKRKQSARRKLPRELAEPTARHRYPCAAVSNWRRLHSRKHHER